MAPFGEEKEKIGKKTLKKAGFNNLKMTFPIGVVMNSLHPVNPPIHSRVNQ